MVSNDVVRRRLTTIFAADVAGYSRLIAADEEATLRTLRSHREIIDNLIAAERGNIFSTAGDSVLAEFVSAVEAVRCALAIQDKLRDVNAELPPESQMLYRIGINVGDVMIDGDDLLGDAVNVAARLEGLAEPGGINISGSTHEQVRNKLPVGFEDIGPQKVKNIPHPVQTFRLVSGSPSRPSIARKARNWRAPAAVLGAIGLLMLAALAASQYWMTDVEPASVSQMKLALPDRPSIVVLPFRNISGDEEQEFFADGITEDIITDISKISGLFVVAGMSSFSLKGKEVETRRAAEEFGVRYVLQGSVRRLDSNLRITAQLTDAIKGNNIWSERYDRSVKDLSAVQSEVTEQVVKAMAVTLKANELDRVFQKHAANIDAYEAFVRARRIVDPPGRKTIEIAQELFRKAIELDPRFAGGYAGLAFSYSSKARLRFGSSPEEDERLSLEFARKAIEVDRNFAWSYIALAGAQLANGNPDAAVEAAREAIRLQPNGYEENLFMGFYLTFAGQPELAVKHLEIAKRISPVDSVRGLAFLANAYFMNGEYARSEELRKKRIEMFPVRNPNPYLWLAATQWHLGDSANAAATAAKFRELQPDFRLSKWRYFDSYKREEDRKRLFEAAVSAGIPE